MSASTDAGQLLGGCIIFDANDSTWMQQNSGMNIGTSYGITYDESGHLLIWGGNLIFRSNDIIISDANSKAKQRGEELSIFPNPCKEFIFINLNNHCVSNENIKITILGSDGKQYFQDLGFFNFPVKLSIENYPIGLLCVLIELGGHHYIFKVIHSN